MDIITFKQVINDSLVPFGYKKQRTNSWIRKGKTISTKVYLQRSLYGNLYYFHVYYVINNLKTTHKEDKECFSGIDYVDEKLLYKMCDLDYDVSDDAREATLKSLLTRMFENHHYIETEEELKKLILEKPIHVFNVIIDYLGIDPKEYHNMWQKRKEAGIMQKLAKGFGIEPTSDYELSNEAMGFYVEYGPEDNVILIKINTIVNPYTQDVKKVYQERLDRLNAFTECGREKPAKVVETIEAYAPSKLGSMQVVLAFVNPNGVIEYRYW